MTGSPVSKLETGKPQGEVQSPRLIHWADVLPGGEIYVLMVASGCEAVGVGAVRFFAIVQHGWTLHISLTRPPEYRWRWSVYAHNHTPVSVRLSAYIGDGGRRIPSHKRQFVHGGQYRYVDELVDALMVTMYRANQAGRNGVMPTLDEVMSAVSNLETTGG